MNTLIVFLTSLPELIKLVQTLYKQMDYQVDDVGVNKRKEVKRSVARISRALKDGDEKALNDVFNSI